MPRGAGLWFYVFLRKYNIEGLAVVASRGDARGLPLAREEKEGV